jgi:hypothetical protein
MAKISSGRGWRAAIAMVPALRLACLEASMRNAEPRAGDVRDLREVEHDVVPAGGAAGEVRIQRGPERRAR